MDAGSVGTGSAAFDAVDFVDQLDNLMSSLDEEEVSMIGLKSDSHTNQQVAEQLGISEQTLRRFLKRLYCRFEKELS